MIHSGCLSSEQLDQLLAGDLPAREQTPLAAHLGDCPRCQAQVEQLLADDSVRTWQRTAAARTAAGPSDDFMDSLRRLVPLVASSSLMLTHPDGVSADEPLLLEAEGAVPEQVGAYQVLGRLGRGGMSVVYKARQPGLGRLVALKVLRLRGPNGLDAARFFREAATVARMQHPNIVQVYEVGEDAGRPFLALEYVPGGTLAQYLRGIPVDPRDAAWLLETVAQAVYHAHQRGIVHRDLKPSNILLGCDAALDSTSRAPLSTLVPKVSDFGLARAATEDQSLTLPGVLVGTPAYLAPESIHQPGAATPVGDVYALGVILYEALTGRAPLVGPTALATLRLVDAVDPVPPSRLQPHLPRDIDTICLTCLHKDPRRRYPSALALAEDVRRFLDGLPIRARRVGRLETAWLWCRRNPVVAALGAALTASVLIGLLAALVLLGQARRSAFAAAESAERASANEARAREQAARADASARLANDRAYASDIQLAAQMWVNHQSALLVDLLDGQRPERTDGIDRRGFEWHFLWASAHPPHRSVPLRSQGWDLAAPRDGRYLAVATSASGVELLDAAGKPFRTLSSSAPVIRVSVSADGLRVAGGCEDGSVRVWDADTGRVLRTLQGHRAAVLGVSFHPDGRLATAGLDGAVRVWDTDDHNARPRVMRLPGVRVSCAAFSPDGKRLAAGGSDGLVRVWDAATWVEQAPLKGHEGDVLALGFSPDSVLLASGSRDRTVRLWDAAGKLVRLLPQYRDAVFAVAFSPDSRFLATATLNRSVRVVAVDAGLVFRTLLGHDDVATGVLFAADSKTLASTGWDRTVRLWGFAADRPQRSWRGHSRPIRAAAFAPDGRLATGSLDGTVRIWDPATGAERRVLADHAGGVLGLAFAPDGRLATTSVDQQVRVWDVAAGRVAHTLTGHKERINDVSFGPDGRLLAGAGERGAVYVWGSARGWERRELAKVLAPVVCVRFDPTGTTLAAGCRDGTVRLLDVATGKQRRQLAGHGGGVTTLAFSPDGVRLAVGSVDGAIRVWDAEAGTLIHTLRAHVRPVTAVGFSPDGRRLFSGSQDHSLRVWHAGSGQPLLVATDPDEATTVAIGAGGATVASAGPAGVITVRRAGPVQ